MDFVLEAQTDAHTQNTIDYSVERVGRGLRHDLGFLYVSRCQGIGLPITEPKRAHAEMEVADLAPTWCGATSCGQIPESQQSSLWRIWARFSGALLRPNDSEPSAQKAILGTSFSRAFSIQFRSDQRRDRRPVSERSRAMKIVPPWDRNALVI